MTQEQLKNIAPKITLPEVPKNIMDMHTRCKCGKFVALSYGTCPVCGAVIVKEVGKLPVEPRKEVVLPEYTEETPTTSEEVVKPKRGRK